MTVWTRILKKLFTEVFPYMSSGFSTGVLIRALLDRDYFHDYMIFVIAMGLVNIVSMIFVARDMKAYYSPEV